MSESEYNLLDNLAFYGLTVIIFGIPTCFAILRLIISKIPWMICFISSSILVYIALLYWHIYLDAPVAEFRRAREPLDDQIGDTGEGAAVLLIGPLIGVFATAFVFGPFVIARVVSVKVNSKRNHGTEGARKE